MMSHTTSRTCVAGASEMISPPENKIDRIGTSGTSGVLNGRGRSGCVFRITHTPALTSTKASNVPTLVISSSTDKGTSVASRATKIPTTIEVGIFVALLATLVPLSVLDEMTSVGTLLAFVLVSAGVWVMRKTHPDLPRPFKTPLVPLVPILSILFSGGLIISLAPATQVRLVVWLIIGLAIYFSYGRKHSKVQALGVAEARRAPSMAD